MWKETVTYGMCVNRIDGVKKDYCEHFLAGGEEGTPEALFCGGCGCHVCFHKKRVTKVGRSIDTCSPNIYTMLFLRFESVTCNVTIGHLLIYDMGHMAYK